MKEQIIASILASVLTFNSVGASSLSKKAKDYVEYFKEFHVAYAYEAFYSSQVIVDSILDGVTKDSESKCSYKGSTDVDQLVEKIKRNSESAVLKNNDFSSFFGLSSTLDSCFEKALNSTISGASNNINEDICRMQTLSIYFANLPTGTISEYDEKENAIKFSKNFLLEVKSQLGALAPMMSDDLLYYSVMPGLLRHTFNHVRSFKCNCNKNQTISSFKYEEDNDYVPFYLESSAENQISDISTSASVLSYSKEKDYEKMLLTLALFTGNNVDDFYNSINDTDYEAFWNFFGAKEKEDIYELFKIIYAMDASLGRNSLPNKVREQTEVHLSDKDIIGNSFRNDLFRITLKNLVEYTDSSKDFTLSDNILIYNIIKSTLYKRAAKDWDKNEDFCSLESKYFKYVSTHYGVSQKEIDTVMCKGKSFDSKEEIGALVKRFPLLASITNISFVDYNLTLTW